MLALPPNQPHRGEIAKLLVTARPARRGIAELLMEQRRGGGAAEGQTLLVLDAVTGGDAARLYARLGWITVGVIPATPSSGRAALRHDHLLQAALAARSGAGNIETEWL